MMDILEMSSIDSMVSHISSVLRQGHSPTQYETKHCLTELIDTLYDFETEGCSSLSTLDGFFFAESCV